MSKDTQQLKGPSSAEKVLLIIETVLSTPGLRQAQIARLNELSTTNVCRLVKTAVEKEFLDEKDNRFYPGRKFNRFLKI